MVLRDYQLRAVAELRAHAKSRPVCVLPTGAGKTVVAAEIIRLATERGRRVLLVAHRRELILQARAKLRQVGIDPGVIMPGHTRTGRPVQVGSIQTLLRRRRVPADLLVIDEAHHATASGYVALLNDYPDAVVIGFTATPARLDGRGLGAVFGALIEPVTAAELVNAEHLISPHVYAPPSADMAGVRRRSGDFADRLELGNRMSKLTGSVVEHYRQHADGWPAVAFACNTVHSRALVSELNQAGYIWHHLDAKTPRSERSRLLRALAEGEIHGLSNCDLFGEGVDVPALRCAILARPTLSLTVYRQQVGRIMRPPGPCVVLDHAGNTHRHGLVTEPIDWSLDDSQRGAQTDSPPPIRQCPACFLVVPPGAGTCPGCGHEFASTPQIPQHEAGQLTAFRVRAENPRDIYAELLRTASDAGYRIGWARGRFHARFGAWPKFTKLEGELYVCKGHEWENTEWGTRCARCRRSPESAGVTRPGGDPATDWLAP